MHVRRLGPVLFALVVVLAATFVVGCGTVPRRYYFSLAYPMDPDPSTWERPALHPYRLRIKPFRIALPYNRPQIVYRQSMFEFRYYPFKLWAAKPQHMFRELVERHLAVHKLCLEVSREYGEELPDYELSGEITAIEEYDSGDVWFGHMSMRFELVRFRDKLPVWFYHFDRKLKVYEKQPVYVVRALSKIAEEEMVRVTAELDAVLSRERGVEPTLDAPPAAADALTGGTGRPEESEGQLIAPTPPALETLPAPDPSEELIVPEDPAPAERP